MSIKTANLGFPGIGRKRELKFALESYWAGMSDGAALLRTARDPRHRNGTLLREAGIAIIQVDEPAFAALVDAARQLRERLAESAEGREGDARRVGA